MDLERRKNNLWKTTGTLKVLLSVIPSSCLLCVQSTAAAEPLVWLLQGETVHLKEQMMMELCFSVVSSRKEEEGDDLFPLKNKSQELINWNNLMNS